MNDTDKDVKTALGFLEISSNLANLAQRLDIANKRGQPLDVAADKDRQITALQTLLTATDALLDFLNKESVVPPAQIAWQIADARVTATNILAESKRIQEGE